MVVASYRAPVPSSHQGRIVASGLGGRDVVSVTRITGGTCRSRARTSTVCAVPAALEPVSVSTTKGGTIVGVYQPNGESNYDSY